MLKKALTAALAAGAAMTLAAPAHAAVVFNLDNVMLVDGGTLTGTFTTSDDLSQLLDFSITSSANSGWPYGNFPGVTYDFDDATSIDYTSARGFRAIFDTGYLDIYSVLPISLTGSTALDQTTAETFRNQTRYLTGGSISAVATAVPEPATWALMILGFGIVGAAMRKRQRVSLSYRPLAA
jgi:hypothetical protein